MAVLREIKLYECNNYINIRLVKIKINKYNTFR